MKRILIGCMLLCGLATTAMAQTTYELMYQADTAYKSADAELNSAYKALVATLNPAQKDSLKFAQRAWIAYRDACIASEAAIFEGGTLAGVVAGNAAAAITLEQVAILKQLLSASLEDGKAAKSSSCDAADTEMQKVYLEASSDDDLVKQAQTAWVKYRDLFLDAVTAIKSETEKAIYCAMLTTMRTARLKELFPEGYPGDAGQTPVESDSDSNMTEGENALLLAMKAGDLVAVEKALKEGADVNKAENDEGATPLHHAANMGNAEMVDLLIKHGANVNAYNADTGLFPITCVAAMGDDVEIVKSLVDAGADVNLGEGGNTILDTVIEFSKAKPHPKIIAYLKSKGAIRGE